jgi:hypothetical protein
VFQTQSLRDHVAGKLLCGQARQGGVEIELVQNFDAQLFQPMQLCLCVHQAEGGRIGGKILARVRLEGQNAERAAVFLCHLAGLFDNRLVAQVNSVEVADGDAGAPIVRVNILIISYNPHFDDL